jgi:hypothetical protein
MLSHTTGARPVLSGSPLFSRRNNDDDDRYKYEGEKAHEEQEVLVFHNVS